MGSSISDHGFGKIGDDDVAVCHLMHKVECAARLAQRISDDRRKQKSIDLVQDWIDRFLAVRISPRVEASAKECLGEGIGGVRDNTCAELIVDE